MKKKLPIIIFIVVVIAAIAGGIGIHMIKRTKLNDGYVNGNTAGNLYNKGLICEYDGMLYFANPSDRNRLYCMYENGTGLTKLSDDTVSYINADEHYIYYVCNNSAFANEFSFMNINTDSLCRINRDGKQNSLLILDTEPSLYASLVGNYIYYLHHSDSEGSTLYKAKIDGKEQTQVAADSFFTACTDGQYIYYNGISNEHYLWRLNTADDSFGMLYGGNCWMPTVVNDGQTVYYIDCDSNYAIACTDLVTKEKTILTPDRIDCYNLCGDYIYFQHNDRNEPALCRMRTDGSDYEVLEKGIYTSINTTADYVYFVDYNSELAYRMRHDDTSSIELFAPGIITED